MARFISAPTRGSALSRLERALLQVAVHVWYSGCFFIRAEEICVVAHSDSDSDSYPDSKSLNLSESESQNPTLKTLQSFCQ